MIVNRNGRFGVRRHLGGGKYAWIGTYALREEAEAAEVAAGGKQKPSQTFHAARMRAVRLFPAEPCEICGATEIARHHCDGQPLNNTRENISFLCNRHHKQAHHWGHLEREAIRLAASAPTTDEAQRIVRAALRATENL